MWGAIALTPITTNLLTLQQFIKSPWTILLIKIWKTKPHLVDGVWSFLAEMMRKSGRFHQTAIS
ncbi:hypothetical protein WA1_50205 [Scytonema hofmannii PCC 7110]|uniref:Transposase n=1 Tax=Scytonema hofmannii PCC 7110 TaxID=128403 RepID=A0A139WR30_9CYAN|nr:hypothetical protein WA1_50205 [Scytonema hofmannii PCC 7110]